MKSIKLNPDHPTIELPAPIAQALRQGGIIAHATETVYGLAVLWDHWKAIQRLSQLKRRSLKQPYSILVSSRESILEILGWHSPALEKLLAQVFPGPLTLIVRQHGSGKMNFWNQFETLGFRMPDHPLCTALVNQAQSPLITTSANLSGTAAPAAARDISSEILNGIDFLLDSGPCMIQQPSTIITVDMEKRSYQRLREGSYSVSMFEEIFKGIW